MFLDLLKSTSLSSIDDDDMIIQSHQSSLSFGPVQMGSKRGRLLIRQQRIKKENEAATTQATDLDTPEATTYSQCLLSVPSPKIEKHAPEPTSTQTTHNLLTVPQTSYLIKQHSHPLLPSQSQSPPTTYTLQRQLSHPISAISGGIATTSSASSAGGSLSAYASTPILVTTTGSTTTTLAQIMGTTLKSEPSDDDSQHQQQQHHHPLHHHHHHHSQQHQTQLQQMQQHSFERSHTTSPTVVIIQETSVSPAITTTESITGSTLSLPKSRGEELARSISTPQVIKNLLFPPQK